MSKNSVWLENGVDRVLVDVGSAAEGYWRDLGYLAVGESLPGQPEAPVEKPVRKPRTKKAAEGSEA